MRRVIVRIGATGAGALLTLGLLAGPSAAKASDKQSNAEEARQSNKVTCFQPEGKTQGRSLSDPDGGENGGADKPDTPDCTGGEDTSDRDGNNGCGNDADREDDNNGKCGGEGGEVSGPPQGQGPGNGPGAQDDGDDVTKTDDGDVSVQGTGLESQSGTPAAAADPTTVDPAAVTDTTPAAQTAATEPETEVLGVTLSAPDTLPRTGAGLGGLALLGGLLVGGGRLTVLARKLLRIG